MIYSRFIPFVLLILYVIAATAMQYHTTTSWSEGLIG